MTSRVTSSLAAWLVLLASSACTAPHAASVEPATSAPASDADAVYLVHGMSCPLCASGIDLMLEKVPGVARVRVDLSTGRVGVYFAPGAHPSDAQLTEAIEKSGFTLVRREKP